jgi:hypothetical protein
MIKMSRNENKEYGTPADRRAADAAVFPADRFHALAASIYHVTLPTKK